MAKSVSLVIEWWVEMIRINLWSSNNALNSHPTRSVYVYCMVALKTKEVASIIVLL